MFSLKQKQDRMIFVSLFVHVILVILFSIVNINLAVCFLYGGLFYNIFKNIISGAAYLLIMDPIYFILKKQALDLPFISIFREVGISLFFVIILIKMSKPKKVIFNNLKFNGECSLLIFGLVVLLGAFRSENLIQYLQSLREYFYPILMIFLLIKLRAVNKYKILVAALLIQIITISVIESYNAFNPNSSLFSYNTASLVKYYLNLRTIFGFSSYRVFTSMFVGGPNLAATALGGISTSLILLAVSSIQLKFIIRCALCVIGIFTLYVGLHFQSYSIALALIIPLATYWLANSSLISLRIRNIVFFIGAPSFVLLTMVINPKFLTFNVNFLEYGLNSFFLPAFKYVSQELNILFFGHNLVCRGASFYSQSVNSANAIATRSWFTYLYNYGLVGSILMFIFICHLSIKALSHMKSREPWMLFVSLIYFSTFAEIHAAPYIVRPFTSILINSIPLIICLPRKYDLQSHSKYQKNDLFYKI